MSIANINVHEAFIHIYSIEPRHIGTQISCFKALYVSFQSIRRSQFIKTNAWGDLYILVTFVFLVGEWDFFFYSIILR